MKINKRKYIMLIVAICATASAAWAIAECSFYSFGPCRTCGEMAETYNGSFPHCYETIWEPVGGRYMKIYYSVEHHYSGLAYHDYDCSENR